MNPDNLDTVDHINGNKENNSIDNLQWLSNADNIRKAQNKKIICIETEKIYNSITEAANELHLHQSHISDCCLGKRKTCGGFHWKYVK